MNGSTFKMTSSFVCGAAVSRALLPGAGVFLGLLCTGCITSPTGAYLVAEESSKLTFSECPGGLVEDGEDGDGQTIKHEGRGGYWFTFADALGSTISPKGPFQMAEGGPSGSKFAARMKGKIAATGDSVYVGMGFALSDPRGLYDASKYKGVTFWGKGPGKVRFKAPDVNTDPSGDRCDDCYNDFGVDIYFSDQWTRYTIPFEQLQQNPGWGDRAPEVAKDKLFALQWQFNTNDAEYDIWIDQVSFVGCE
jgi:endoglucanase